MNTKSKVFQHNQSGVGEPFKSNLTAFKRISFKSLRRNKKTDKDQTCAEISEQIGKELRNRSLDENLVVLQEYPLNEPFAYATIVRHKISGNVKYVVKELSLTEEEESIDTLDRIPGSESLESLDEEKYLIQEEEEEESD